MKKYLVFALFCFLVIGGCSKEGDTEKAGSQTSPLVPQGQDLTPPPVAEKQVQNLEPVKILPDDQKKVEKAPAGMAFIKGGCFMMGNDHAQSDEHPRHEVCLDDFYMDKYEVTQARWKKIMGNNPSKFVGDDLPVEQVNYFEAQNFARKSNGECRLPTEAEWEYAAAGGTESRYYWGDMMDNAYAWFEDNSEGKTHPVGKKLPNQYGLYDMMGNVWEWVDDWYAAIYQETEKQNPKGPPTGENKVVRGGAFDSSAGALRVTNRTWLNPSNRVYSKMSSYGGIVNEIFNYVGFRCAKSVETPKAATPPKK